MSPTLSQLEQMALLAVLRLGEEAHGTRLREYLADEADYDVTVPTLYVALSRLEGRGLVRSWKAEPTAVRGGKARRFYAVEKLGIEELRRTREVMDRLWTGAESPMRLEDA